MLGIVAPYTALIDAGSGHSIVWRILPRDTKDPVI